MLKLKRTYHNDCVTGFMTYDEFRAHTLELPDLNNQQDISCIYEGVYECEKHFSSKNGNCIWIKNTIGRSHVQIHIANYLHDILGCIAVGDGHATRPSGEIMVTNSTKTMNKLLAILPDKFLLEIK